MRYALLLTTAACLVMPVVGCSALDDAARIISGRPVGLERADQIVNTDLELRAFIAASSWHALQVEGARLAAAPDTPDALRDAIREADAAGSPVMAALTRAAETYGALAPPSKASNHEAVHLQIALGDSKRVIDALSSLVVAQGGAE